MARKLIPQFKYAGHYSAQEITEQASDPTNNHYVLVSGNGNEGLVAINTHTADLEVTILSQDANRDDWVVSVPLSGQPQLIGPLSGHFMKDDFTVEINVAGTAGQLQLYAVDYDRAVIG